ncbi:hypothetical protein PIIN_09659 [Serendipita indica DSM 11827]|uniref:Uncharacterized protein n=1 Tax=Serendipita indica (strain DSM 11827) TaxID=1109443 RepID=G4TWH6_SERID|nr:hypothetical protein PIIN_09659 [Serendipita indica DSM 11827]
MKFSQTLLSLLLAGAAVQAHPMVDPNHSPNGLNSKRTPLATNEVNQSIQPSSSRPQEQILTPFLGAARKQVAFAPHKHQKRAKSSHPALTNEDSDAMESKSTGRGVQKAGVFGVAVEGVSIGIGRPNRLSRKGHREELEERGLRPRTQPSSGDKEQYSASRKHLATPELAVTVERGRMHGIGKKRLDHNGRGIKAPDYKTDEPTPSGSAEASSPSATKQPSLSN